MPAEHLCSDESLAPQGHPSVPTANGLTRIIGYRSYRLAIAMIRHVGNEYLTSFLLK